MATKKKELLEQEAPVTETVMSEGETLLADTAQPESLPADAGDGLDLNELLGQMDQPLEDTSAEDMAEDPLPELTEEEMFGNTPSETDDQSAAPTDMPEDSDVQPPDVYEDNADAVQEPPASPKPKRTSRKKKEAAAPEETVTEEVPAETTESADGAQLIFTSHNTNLLDLDVLRRDQIWFTEKDEQTAATDLFSLYDFSIRKDAKVEKGYLIGRYGAIPFIKGGL